MPVPQCIRVLRDRVPDGPARDTAVCRALLDAVARREQPESLRLWRPDAALAFSVADRTRPGFPRAVAAAHAAGFAPFLRLAGGHAAVYTGVSLAFAWTRPLDDAYAGLEDRFRELSSLVAGALRRLGVDARVGPVAGEYCPGAHSVNARGRVKLMGVGQRVVRGAAHVGGVIVVNDAARAREVLVPVHAALGLDFDPSTVGGVGEESPAATCEDVAGALLAELGARYDLAEAQLEAATHARARALEPQYRIEADAAAPRSPDPRPAGIADESRP